MATLTNWTFEVTTRHGMPAVKITNAKLNYRTYGILTPFGGIGWENANISPITPEIEAHISALLIGDKQ